MWGATAACTLQTSRTWSNEIEETNGMRRHSFTLPYKFLLYLSHE